MNSAPAPIARRRRCRTILVALGTPLLALTAPAATATDTATGVDVAGHDAPAVVTPTAEGPAVSAIRQLVEDGTVSDELEELLGYQPGEKNGFATDPAGSCSSPVELPASFDLACRTHDLGYDLLRAAADTGETIPPELRATLDRQFYQRITETCAGPACQAAAMTTRIAVSVNTLRQGGGAPVTEEWPWSDWLD